MREREREEAPQINGKEPFTRVG